MKQKFIFEKTGIEISTHNVAGFRHKTRLEGATCVGCQKKIVKDEYYISFNTIRMGREIIHVECYHYPSIIAISSTRNRYLRQTIWTVRNCEDEYDALRDIIEKSASMNIMIKV